MCGRSGTKQCYKNEKGVVMKKLFMLILLGVMFGSIGFCEDYACPNTYVLNSGFSKFLSNATGGNFFYTKALEQVLEKQAKKEFKGKFDVKLKSFSKKDLKEGKFKSITATGENIDIDGVSIQKITLNSLCEYNQFAKNDSGKYEFVTDFPAALTFELTPQNINQIKNMPEFKTKLDKINSELKGFLKISDMNFDLKDDKLIYDINYILPFSPNEQKISVSADVAYFNNTVYNQTETANGKSVVLNFFKMTNALNYINPLDFSIKFLQNNNVAGSVQNVYIRDNKVFVEALLNITK